jgi:hypothetical protein
MHGQQNKNLLIFSNIYWSQLRVYYILVLVDQNQYSVFNEDSTEWFIILANNRHFSNFKHNIIWCPCESFNILIEILKHLNFKKIQYSNFKNKKSN